MPERRPPWCKEISCPAWPGYDMCYLKEWVITNWLSYQGKKRELGKIEDLAASDPQKVIDHCQNVMQYPKT